MSPVPDLPLQLVYAAQKRVWRWVRPRTRGVKVSLFNAEGEILLIRNAYGNRDLWVLPGGGVRPWEQPDQAAVREVREELGCRVEGLIAVATFTSNAEGKRDTIHLFEAHCDGEPKADAFEVAEARFFTLETLPESVSPATLRRIDERQGRRTADGKW